MADIRKAQKDDYVNIARILLPVFSDKAEAILGDAGQAEMILPMMVDAFKGLNLIASENNRPVGAIIVTTEELKLPSKTFKIVRNEVGFFGALRAIRIVKNYEKSLPQRLEGEVRLEAVGVTVEARNRGIGTQLIRRAEEWSVKNDMKHFGLSVKTDNPAVRLYKRLGFSRVTSFTNRLGRWSYMRKTFG